MPRDERHGVAAAEAQRQRLAPGDLVEVHQEAHAPGDGGPPKRSIALTSRSGSSLPARQALRMASATTGTGAASLLRRPLASADGPQSGPAAENTRGARVGLLASSTRPHCPGARRASRRAVLSTDGCLGIARNVRRSDRFSISRRALHPPRELERSAGTSGSWSPVAAPSAWVPARSKNRLFSRAWRSVMLVTQSLVELSGRVSAQGLERG